MINLGELSVKVTAQTKEATQSLDDFKKNISDTELTGKEKFKALGKTMKSFAKVAGKAMVAAGAVAVAAIIKDSVKAYAEYEQLAGGVETLFGDAADSVKKNAEKAYKSAGLSVNQYMEQVTSFSASLIKSTGGDTEKAAKLADVAIQDMSDNVNTFGSDVESVQNAYQGFAKQNFTMLDNLKLGYGGTKEGMQQLIDDANKLREEQGLNADLTIDDYGDIVEAIHTVQQAQKITGKTAAEASTTIQGSLATAKAAYENFAVALASGNEEEIQEALDNLSESIVTFLENLIPLVVKVVASLLQAIINRIDKWITKATGKVLKFFKNIIKEAKAWAKNLISNMREALVGKIQEIVDKIKAKWDELKKKFGDTWWFKAVETAVGGIATAIGKVIDTIKSIISWWDSLKRKLSEKIEGSVLINKNPTQGLPKRIGLDEVPYDNYPALLHKGEVVLTASEANQFQKYLDQIESGFEGVGAKTVASSTPQVVTLNIDGKEFARFMSPLMNKQINLLTNRSSRLQGVI